VIPFFDQDIPVFNLKIPYKDHTPYRYTLVGYRRQPYHQTKYRKDPKNMKIAKQAPGSFANWISPPAITSDGRHPPSNRRSLLTIRL